MRQMGTARQKRKEEREVRRMTAGMLIAMTICAFIGFMMGGLCSASSGNEALAASERRCREIADKCRELAEENLSLEEEVEELRAEIKRKVANIDVLDDVIIRMRTKPVKGSFWHRSL